MSVFRRPDLEGEGMVIREKKEDYETNCLLRLAQD